MPPINFDALIKDYQTAQTKANQQNLERYQALLTHIEGLGQQVGTQGTFGEAANLLEQVGTAAQTRIADQKIKAQATTEQGLISRGLGNTTIRAAARRGIASDAERAMQESEESLAQKKAGLLTQRAGAETQIGGMKATAIEGRQDVGPDLAAFASLLQAAAASESATGGAKRTATIMGPQAQAGRDVFGQPMGRFGGGGLGGGGAGGGGGGISSSGGGGGGGRGQGAGQYFPPGSFGKPVGSSRVVTPQPVGRAAQGPLATAGASQLGTPAPAGTMTMTPTTPTAPAGQETTASVQDSGIGLFSGPGGVLLGGGESSGEQKGARDFATYAEYSSYMRSVGKTPMNSVAWKYAPRGR